MLLSYLTPGTNRKAKQKRGIKEEVIRKQFSVVVTKVQILLPINTDCSSATVYPSLYYYFLSICAQ